MSRVAFARCRSGANKCSLEIPIATTFGIGDFHTHGALHFVVPYVNLSIAFVVAFNVVNSCEYICVVNTSS